MQLIKTIGDDLAMKWKFFIGASILASGLLFQAGAPILPVVTGIALAAFATWKKSR